MSSRVREVVAGAFRDLSTSWRTLALTDLGYKALAFGVLTPATVLFLKWLLSRSGTRVVADADIARFFLTTPQGIVAIVIGGSIIAAISLLEASCLMAVGLAAARGSHLPAKAALIFGASRAASVLRLCGQMIVRVIAGVIPFAIALGLVYAGLLRGPDINYFLSRKPPEFWIAAGLAGVIVAALAYVLVRTVLRWALALPLVLFEGVPPYRALAESGTRSENSRGLIALVVAGWAIAAIALNVFPNYLVKAIVRGVAPQVAGSAAALILFFTAVLMIGLALSLILAIASSVLISLLIVRIWLHTAAPGEVRGPVATDFDAARERRVSGRLAGAIAATAVLCAVGVALVTFIVTRAKEPVLVIAHRGASTVAPENTLAAFRQALAEHADYVELDVQETLDGEVLVAHDSDFMKVAGSPMKIWEHTAAELRTIDIGSFMGPAFKGERAPTLAEALATCKGSARVLIELKSYGHNQRLEQRVVDVVEAAGMQTDCAYMSLDHGMVRTMKRLRPSWRVGALAAKALGDPTTLGADFLAVEARMADARFIRRAHRARQDVYVWTLDDPTWMLSAMSSGADGMITNKPALAREVAQRRENMSDAQRMLVALLVRAGARTGSLESEAALRP